MSEDLSDLPNLASAQLGSHVVFATDEWFASAENMLQDSPAVWKADLYTSYGKWMDGWESRRRRSEGHDWCIVKLGLAASRIHAIEVDTAFFTGNFSPKVSIYGIYLNDGSPSHQKSEELLELRKSIAASRGDEGRMGLAASPEEADLVNSLDSENWPVLVPLQPLGAGYEETRRTIFKVAPCGKLISHLRVNMGPDGGIARIRVYGEVHVSPDRLPHDVDVDLASVEYGGRAIGCSNAHYGHPRNLVAPGRGTCMGDGWETARQPKRPAVYQRGEDGLMVLPGCDWALLQLGLVGVVSALEVDTHFYKGNYPESCLIEACHRPDATAEELQLDSIAAAGGGGAGASSSSRSIDWKVLLPRTRLGPSAIHKFSSSSSSSSPTDAAALVQRVGPITHVRITIYPDGGVMRLRLYGRQADSSTHSKL